jgi:hypothetical protein
MARISSMVIVMCPVVLSIFFMLKTQYMSLVL